MSIASEITRLQGVKADILTAIGNKGVTVPADSMLDDCPDLIASIGEDVIGGKKYKTVQMPDGKIWLAENLDFKFCHIGGSKTTTMRAWYYNDDESTYGWNGYKCGLLYNWYAVDVLNTRRSELIPGWHVPTKDEWDALATACGGASTAGAKLKALDDSAGTGFPSGWNGTDDYGFSILPTGGFYGNFEYVGRNAPFWTSSVISYSEAYDRYFDLSAGMDSVNHDKQNGFAIRLVRDT